MIPGVLGHLFVEPRPAAAARHAPHAAEQQQAGGGHGPEISDDLSDRSHLRSVHEQVLSEGTVEDVRRSIRLIDLMETVGARRGTAPQPQRCQRGREALNRRLEARLEPGDQRLVAHVRSTLRRLEEVVDALMAYERATGPLRRRPVDLGDVVRTAVEIHADELGPDDRIDIGELSTVDGDQALLLALFRPLIENAIKFAHPQRPLRARIDSRPAGRDGWVIVVEDDGVGILAADTERVFQMYERGEPGRLPGQGAGLAAARRIAEAHGGAISAEPRTHGTAIVVMLPANR